MSPFLTLKGARMFIYGIRDDLYDDPPKSIKIIVYVIYGVESLLAYAMNSKKLE
jgi:hypothetical protein